MFNVFRKLRFMIRFCSLTRFVIIGTFDINVIMYNCCRYIQPNELSCFVITFFQVPNNIFLLLAGRTIKAILVLLDLTSSGKLIGKPTSP